MNPLSGRSSLRRGFAAAVFLLVPLAVGSAAAQEEVDRTIRSSPTGSVEVYNPSGSVVVTGWNRPEIHVVGRLGRGTERLEIQGGPENTTIRVVLERGRSEGSDLTIRVPAGKNVLVRTTSGDVEIRETTGEVEATSVSGDLDVEGSLRAVRVHTTSGDVEVTGNVRGTTEARSVSGDVRVGANTNELQAESVSGEVIVEGRIPLVRAATVSGNGKARVTGLKRFAFQSVSGELELGADPQPRAVIDVQSHSGNIVVGLPRGFAAAFKANTFSGSIRNGFSAATAAAQGPGPGRELRFSTGGESLVTVNTFSGMIRLMPE